HKGSYITSLFPIGRISAPEGALLPANFTGPIESQFGAIASKLSKVELATKGKETLSLVFYLDDKHDQTLPVRLGAEFASGDRSRHAAFSQPSPPGHRSRGDRPRHSAIPPSLIDQIDTSRPGFSHA